MGMKLGPTLKEEHKTGVFENRLLRTYGAKTNKMMIKS
jgi:hypothetical protein